MISKNDTRYYGRIFFVMTISIVFTITVLSGILYISFERIALQQSYDQTLDNLAQTTQEASVMAITASTFAKQIYSDQHIANLLNFPNVNPVEISTAIRQLTNYRETSPFIDSIYVYNAKAHTFYVSTDMNVAMVFDESEFYDHEMRDMLKNLDAYESLMPIPRKLSIEGLAGNIAEKQRDIYSFLLYDNLMPNVNKNAIVVNIKETQLHKHIDGSLTNDPANTFLIDTDGYLVSNSWKYPMLRDMKGTSYIDRILDKPNSSGYFAEEVDGVKSLVTYTEPDYLGWRYIRILPYTAITERIDNMRVKTIIIAGSILLIGLGFSYFISRKLFSGLSKKLSQLGILEADQRNSIQSMKYEYLRGLLNGDAYPDPDYVKTMFIRYGIDLDPFSSVSVVLITVDEYHSFIETYTIEDRKLLRFGILNIAQEMLIDANCATAAVVLGDDRIAVIVQPEGEMDENDRESILEYAGRIQTAVSQYLKLSITISTSMIGQDIQSIHGLCLQAVEASFSRVFRGPGSIIDSEMVELKKSKPYEYPLDKERQLIDELYLGRMPVVKELFSEIIRDTENYSYISFQLAVSHLSFALQNAIRKIGRRLSVDGELAIPSMTLYMHEWNETLEEFMERYMNLFDRLERHMDENKRRSKQDGVSEHIIQLIDEKYADSSLSLDMLADELGLSADYIGRIFKQTTSKTILSYIQDVRMNKVRELLGETEDSIGDIAERAGFTNNPYFYKAFKKHNGVTPAQYRRISGWQGEQDSM